MYAIVNIAGQQFKVENSQKIYVHRLTGNTGDQVEFSNVLLLDKEGTVVVGTPSVEGAKVIAKILAHVKGDKVVVFKKKRRKGYAKMNGHRQFFTQIEILGVLGKGDEFVAPAETKKVKTKKQKAVEDTMEGKEIPVKKKSTKNPIAKKTTAKKTSAKKK